MPQQASFCQLLCWEFGDYKDTKNKPKRVQRICMIKTIALPNNSTSANLLVFSCWPDQASKTPTPLIPLSNQPIRVRERAKPKSLLIYTQLVFYTPRLISTSLFPCNARRPPKNFNGKSRQDSEKISPYFSSELPILHLNCGTHCFTLLSFGSHLSSIGSFKLFSFAHHLQPPSESF